MVGIVSRGHVPPCGGGRRVCHGGPATAVRASPTAPGAAAPGRLLWCAYSRRARRRSGCGGAMSAPAPAGPTSPTVADVRRVLGIVVHADPGPLRAGAPRCSCFRSKGRRFQSRLNPCGSSTLRASRSTSQTPSRSSAVRESARDSGSPPRRPRLRSGRPPTLDGERRRRGARGIGADAAAEKTADPGRSSITGSRAFARVPRTTPGRMVSFLRHPLTALPFL